MQKTTIATFRDPIVQGLISLVLAAAALATLLWIADAYLDPGLRKAIIFAGFAMC